MSRSYLLDTNICIYVASISLRAWPHGSLASPSERSGCLRSRTANSGTAPRRARDLWIAAHALALDVTRVTDNVRDFERVPALRLDDWVV